MATTFALELNVTGNGSLKDDLGVWAPTGSFDIGTGVDKIQILLEDGVGDNAAKVLYVSRQTINAGASFALNLFGGTLTDFRGTAINLTALKGVLVVLRAPTSATRFTIGPDGGATPLQAWFNSTAAGQKTTHYHFCLETMPWTAGWPVVAANDCLYIGNPSATAIEVDVVAWGI